jgi:hypothetical protein
MESITMAVHQFRMAIQQSGIYPDKKGFHGNEYIPLEALLAVVISHAAQCGLSYDNEIGEAGGRMAITHHLSNGLEEHSRHFVAARLPEDPIIDLATTVANAWAAAAEQADNYKDAQDAAKKAKAAANEVDKAHTKWGACRTYCLRTTLMAFIGLHPDKDWDGDVVSPEDRKVLNETVAATSNGKAPAQSNVNGKVVAAKSNGKVAAKPLTARESLHVAMKAAGLTDKGDMQEEFDSLILIFGGKPQSDADWAKFLAKFLDRLPSEMPATAA